jgi:transposase
MSRLQELLDDSRRERDAVAEERDRAFERVRELEQRVEALQAQVAEMTKLSELQKADLDRYKNAYEAAQPNHPERAPREQLQLAFERVLEMLDAEPPANDDDDPSAPPSDGSNVATDPTSTAGTNGSQPKRRHRHGRRRLDLSNLPVIEQRIEPPEVIASGGEGFELIGQEVSERVARRPAEWVRYRLVRPKYMAVAVVGADALAPAGGTESESETSDGSDRRDEAAAADDHSAAQAHDGCAALASEAPSASDSERPAIIIAPLPESIWPNVMGDPSAIAHVIISKYGDLLPLNRQQSISARQGFLLPKSTQCGWLNAANGFCGPVVDAMFDDGRKNAFLIATDATGASVLPPRKNTDGAPGAPRLWPAERRRCDSWHVFVFIADRDHVVFRYDRENNGAVMAKMLKGFSGNLLADAASVFDVLYRDHGMTEHGCWFHCRRPFYRALETDRERAFEALSLIGKLFEVDRNLRAQNLELEAFTRLRAERSRPILTLFDGWIALHRERVDPRGPLDAAIGYYDNQRDALHRFLEDGRIRLDNNLSEQELRNLVIGEANWIFFANETGIRWYTTFRSLITSCRLHGLNPEIYLEQLLRIVPNWPKNRALELSPKYWLQTVASLDARWRAMLARPWEPSVIASAEISPPRRADIPAIGAA